ncbi:hypothetical protein NDU88_001160 [Pleurodeles waltl]|uniref:CUB domain-containing protein n=1 Tax=Pleurodeles waltl TaxID=8319 RepID=A0AAV7NCN7_PLEWA|nr:hypothetical protein NDU88_001160 [Pleurodeles waltl]
MSAQQAHPRQARLCLDGAVRLKTVPLCYTMGELKLLAPTIAADCRHTLDVSGGIRGRDCRKGENCGSDYVGLFLYRLPYYTAGTFVEEQSEGAGPAVVSFLSSESYLSGGSTSVFFRGGVAAAGETTRLSTESYSVQSFYVTLSDAIEGHGFTAYYTLMADTLLLLSLRMEEYLPRVLNLAWLTL